MYHHDNRNEEVATAEAVDNLQNTIDERIRTRGPVARTGLERIRDIESKIDDQPVWFGVGAGKFSEEPVAATDKPGLVLRALDRRIHPAAIPQLADRINIPYAGFVRELAESGELWQRELAAQVVNSHAAHSEQTLSLCRSSEDMVKAVLSSRYCPWDTWLVAESFVKAVEEVKGELIRAEYDGLRVCVEAIRPEIFKIDMGKNGVEGISVGATYSNSSFGHGGQTVAFAIERAWCTNRAISKNNLRNVHLGGELKEDIILSRRTFQARTLLHLSTIHDTVHQLFSPTNIQLKLVKIQKAGQKELEASNIDKTISQYRLTTSEGEQLKQLLMTAGEDIIPRGPLTTWKLSQAISALAGEEDVPLSRRRELEEAAGNMLGLSGRSEAVNV